MAQSFNLKAIISAVDRVTGPMKNINRALRSPIKAMQDVANASAGLGRNLGGVLGPASMLVGGGGLAGIGAGVSSIIRTSAEFERYAATLEVIEGSSAKARASLGWVDEFAQKTPYTLKDVTASFVQLRSIGVDPMNGALKAAGDAAAVMNTGIGDAVSAISSAMRGELDPIEQFGVTAETVGNKLVFHWEHMDKKFRAIADKNDRAAVSKTLQDIWNRKFGGAMEKQSQTWDGMTSNLGDSWERFERMIGEAGFFDGAKRQLGDLLSTIDAAFKSGKAAEFAGKISKVLEGAIVGLREKLMSIDWDKTWQAVERFGTSVDRSITTLGGMGNVALIVGAVMAGPLIASVLQVGGAVSKLGMALWATTGKMMLFAAKLLFSQQIGAFTMAMKSGLGVLTSFNIALAANPIGLVITAVGLLAGAAWLIYENWDAVTAWFSGLWDGISETVGGAVGFISALLTGDMAAAMEGLARLGKGLASVLSAVFAPVVVKGIGGLLGINLPDMSAAASAATSGPLASVGEAAAESRSSGNGPTALSPALALAGAKHGVAGAASTSQLTGEVVMRFENAPSGFRVGEVRTNQPGLAMRTDVGYRMGAVVGP